ncbi:unnamed protein product, partial [Ixodes hexagonus]
FFYSTGVYLRLFNCIAMLCLIAHWNACLQFFVPRMQNFPADSWVARQKLINSSWWEQYSWSMYNAMSQMVSCGYGRTAAENTTDAWLTCLGMASGTIGYALLLGLCANMIQTMDHTRRLHREKLKEVEDYMQYQKLPNKLRNRIRDYFENRYGGHVFDEANILASLSDPLKEVPKHQSCREAHILQPQEYKAGVKRTIREGIVQLATRYCTDDDLDCSRQSPNKKDAVQVMKDGEQHMVVKRSLSTRSVTPNHISRAELCLLTKAKRRANVVAETYCHLLSLSDKDFHQALEGRPLMKKAMDELVREQQAKRSVNMPD